jgi:N-acetylglucosaminyldiphosphoundecaprenol N-acetyl-beta-D-mannosaminyltransferase
MAESIEDILSKLNRETPSQICFVNADCANIAYKNGHYLRVLQGADLCLADGIGLKLGAKILGQDIKQNVNGTDLFPRLCESLSRTGKGIYLLGARPGVAESVARWVQENAPDTTVSGFRHGYFDPEEEAAVIEDIRRSGARLLLVAFGAPHQDLWINEHLHETGVNLAMGVGGLFDFYSGRLTRAPVWMREMGMEWVYRLIQEPGRLWKRYLIGNGVFLSRVTRERLFGDPVKTRDVDTEA